MANSKIAGPLGLLSGATEEAIAIGEKAIGVAYRWFLGALPARTPGPLGRNDAGDPTKIARPGDTPGPLGINDHADPNSRPRSGTPSTTDAKSHALKPTIRRDIIYETLILNKERFCELYSVEPVPTGVISTDWPFTSLSNSQSNNLYQFLDLIAGDQYIKNIRHVAYMMATALHENGTSWAPIPEINGGQKDYGKPEIVVDEMGRPLAANGTFLTPARDAAEGSTELVKGLPYLKSLLIRGQFYGRGFPQITHQDSYRLFDNYLKLQRAMLLNPDRALDFKISYRILSFGMRYGSFTSKKLDDYITGTKVDYGGARWIINAQDKADKIAQYAGSFERILQYSRTDIPLVA